MKSIMQSIHSIHCENIAIGRKGYEVRKTKPNKLTPFKVYIYETKNKKYMNLGICIPDKNINFVHAPGKIIAEYICDEIIEWTEDMKPPVPLSKLCLSYSQIRQYGGDKPLYLWHISNLKIYDEPKELSEFYTICNKDDLDQCGNCKYLESWGSSYPCEDSGGEECSVDNKKPLTRPPQSWCYVGEV